MEEIQNAPSEIKNKLLRAAAYVRMSTDHQKYSIENQLVAINKYAEGNKFEVVNIFADPGVSGLTYEKRDGLKRLIESVQSGKADFKIILVLDVSRWGRFQDVDESAYYEYSCRRAGINVHYVTENFQTDNLPLSAILKAIKRAMAGEYSREMSAKIVASKIRMGQKGFRQNLLTGYGLRRAAIDQHGNFKCVLGPREAKQKNSDRTILVPGPKHEVRIVREVFKYFVKDNYKMPEIAKILNRRRIKTLWGRRWRRSTIAYMLQNETYIGTNVFNKTHRRLGGRYVCNPREEWGRAYNVYEPIVPLELFKKAQEKIARFQYRPSDEEMLLVLQGLQKCAGKLTFDKIDKAGIGFTTSSYQKRFGTLRETYKLIGMSTRNYTYYKIKGKLSEISNSAKKSLSEKIQQMGISVGDYRYDHRWRLFIVGGKIRTSFLMCHCSYPSGARGAIWVTGIGVARVCDWIIAICMDKNNDIPERYYLIPASDVRKKDWITFSYKTTHYTQKYSYKNMEEIESRFSQIVVSSLTSNE